MTLLALLLPALAFPVGLWLLHEDPRFWWAGLPAQWPIEVLGIAVAGTCATLAGLLDWIYHRRGHRRIPAPERRCELLALGLAVPLLVLLGCASVAGRPGMLLVPVLALSLVIAGLIAHDETRYHRGCTRYETALHRILVIGNGIAFLCWTHWCFANEVGHARMP